MKGVRYVLDIGAMEQDQFVVLPGIRVNGSLNERLFWFRDETANASNTHILFVLALHLQLGDGHANFVGFELHQLIGCAGFWCVDSDLTVVGVHGCEVLSNLLRK